MTRRDIFKVAGVTAAVAATTSLAGCAADSAAPAEAPAVAPAAMLMGPSKGKRVVIIGAGYGGLKAAKEIRKGDASIEVVVLDKRDIFFSCPFSNALLGGLEGVTVDTLTRDLYSGAQKYGYSMIQATVTGIDKASKTVMTNNGNITYDKLVLSPGIEYDYKKSFPTWTDEKILHVSQAAPAAFKPGSEHLALKRLLDNMEEGNVVITIPSGKYRCPPGPSERASMIANWMKKEDIPGKVILLVDGAKFSKQGAFVESWKDIYGDKLEFVLNAAITDVDMDKKTVTYKQIVGVDKQDNDIVETKTVSFAVLNLVPKMKASPVVGMAGVAQNAWGGLAHAGASFASKDDANIYGIGDITGHGLPPSGQSANWTATYAAKEIVAALNGKTYDITTVLPFAAANVCYSMVGEGPEEGIRVTHEYSFNGTVLKGKGNVPKDGGDKYRSAGTGKALREWYRGIMDDMFL
jgi:NADPH-dependent 2,4-dienoyl-CoA reductase/sulfur reductase-like enzyme